MERKQISNKLFILFLALLGELYKLCINLRLIRPKTLIQSSSSSKPKIIVSLTSYGRRVKNVHYTIISLLRQTIKPDIIVLWLDNSNWDDSNIPKSIKILKRYGLTIKYCHDIKSYKKLIPSLQSYPNDIIITCDDDIYYRKSMVKRLIEAYEKDPSKIYAHRAHEITFTNKQLNKYRQWKEEVSNMVGKRIFPTSGGGTLYTRKNLFKDVCNERIFNELCPNADDVWNYFMGFLQGTNNQVLTYTTFIYIPLDIFYQALHRDSNLSSLNCGESMNDKQIRAIMDYYKIKDQDLYDN